jgi:hypothetical protein
VPPSSHTLHSSLLTTATTTTTTTTTTASGSDGAGSCIIKSYPYLPVSVSPCAMPEAAQLVGTASSSVRALIGTRGAPASIHQHPPPPRSDHPGLSCYRGGTLHPGRNDSAGGPHQFSAPSRLRDACRVPALRPTIHTYIAHCEMPYAHSNTVRGSGKPRATLRIASCSSDAA